MFSPASYAVSSSPPLTCGSTQKTEKVCTPPPDTLREIAIAPGDRYLLYTDGIIETENTKGEAFGDRKFEEIIRESQSRPSSELSDRILAELKTWRPSSTQQQDDLTLIVVDML